LGPTSKEDFFNELVSDAVKMINECKSLTRHNEVVLSTDNSTTSSSRSLQITATKDAPNTQVRPLQYSISIGMNKETGTSTGQSSTATIYNPLWQFHSTSAALYCRTSIQSVDIDARIIVATNNNVLVFVWNHDSESGNSMSSLKPITTYQAHPLGSYLLKAMISLDSHHVVTTGSENNNLIRSCTIVSISKSWKPS